ncbi:SYP1 [Wickerhamiella sorbophila]|uniref:SYP1 n=1 Tax=Wickerhamiella sorbophila TaxID=45607 RepID=A0A2T0FKN9_9ASCO|nr:SYP1 [Wickerhamiella sorbophila]PRT55542.1 SYP1 [Wickerhamiella sorbophila]
MHGLEGIARLGSQDLSPRMKYSAALSGHIPGTATDLLRHRINTGRKTTDNIVDWMEHFAQVNEAYAQEMERMLRRISIPDTDLGTLATAWNGCASMAVEIARLSSMLGSRVRVEVKQPLVDFLASGWTPAESALKGASLSNDRVNEEKVDSIQRADLARLVTIKESLLKFQTLVADEGQALSKASEKGLRELLAFEPQEDIESYIAQIVAGAAVAEPERTRATSSATTSHTSRRQASLQSLRSNQSTNEDAPKHSGIRAKVGSLFGRRKHKNNNLELRRAASINSSFQEGAEYEPEPTRSRTSSVPQQSHTDPLPVNNRRNTDIRSGPASEPSTSNGRVPPPAPPPQRVNQSASHLPPNHAVPLHLHQQMQAPPPSQSPPFDSPFHYPGQEAPKAASQEDLVGVSVSGPPSSNRRRRDIQSALFTGVEATQRESMVLNPKVSTPLNGSPDQEEFFTPAQQFQPTFESQRTTGNVFHPVMEESPSMMQSSPVFTSAAASINTAAALHAVPEPSKPAPAQQPFQSAPPAGAPSEAPAQPVATGATAADISTTSVASFDQDGMGHAPNFSRTGSTRRSAGLQRAFTGDVTSSHPALPTVQGLVVTVKETLTAKIVDGTISEVHISGEINGACNGAPVRTVVRLDGSENAQTLVPNAPYLNPTNQGLYEVDTSMFAGQTVTLAKYTGQLPEKVPIIFTPAWRNSENQARLMLSYSLPESYPHDSVTIDNLVVAVMVTGGHATSAQSKPIATFSQEKQRVTWRFAGPVQLKRGQVERLLCQLATESRAEEAPGGIEVRFSVTNSDPALRSLQQNPSSGEWTAVPSNAQLFVSRYTASSLA